jgi:hypothetical protein
MDGSDEEGYDGNSTLAKSEADLVVDCHSNHVANEMREKDERHNGARYMIIALDLRLQQY